MTELVEIVDHVLDGGPLRAAAVECATPQPGYGVEISGWAVPVDGVIEKIEIYHGGVVLRTTTPNQSRTGTFGFGLPGVYPIGFRTFVSLLGLPHRSTLQVVARLGDEQVEIAALTLQREPLRVVPSPAIHPLIVTTLGRSGSVWLSRLVGQHPAIVSYRPFELEPRIGSYWMYALRDLGDPASILQGVAPLGLDDLWWLAPRDLGASTPVPVPEITEWVARDHVQRVARFCLEGASAFYEHVAALQGKDAVVFYAEKYLPSFVPAMLRELDAGAKEVFLVRDPRDQLASVVSWTAAGRAQFSPDAKTAEEYVDWLGPQTKSLLRHWQARRETSLLVRYEDLILAPEATLTRLFEYLGLDSSAQTVNVVVGKAGRAKRKLQRQHRTSGSAEKSVARWRTDIDAALWPRLEEVFAPELEAWYREGVAANG